MDFGMAKDNLEIQCSPAAFLLNNSMVLLWSERFPLAVQTYRNAPVVIPKAPFRAFLVFFF